MSVRFCIHCCKQRHSKQDESYCILPMVSCCRKLTPHDYVLGKVVHVYIQHFMDTDLGLAGSLISPGADKKQTLTQTITLTPKTT